LYLYWFAKAQITCRCDTVSQENYYVSLHCVAVEHLFNTSETCYHNNLIDIK